MKTTKYLLVTLAISALLMAVACKKPEETGETTYTVTNRLTDTEAWGGITATVYEYDTDDQRVDSNILVCPEKGVPYTFKANDIAHHVKVKLTSSEQTVRWGKSIVTLTPGHDTPITVGISMLTNYSLTEPKL